MRATLILLCFSLAACRTSNLGTCAHDTDCSAGAACSAEGLCVEAACASTCPSKATCEHGACVTNDCNPACGADQTCQSGVCVGQACTPPCDSSHTCDASSHTCVPVQTADLTLNPPPAFASGPLHVTASAHAPGGVTSVKFDLSSGGAVKVSGIGAAGSSDPSLYAADLSLTGIADGPASVTATLTYGSQTMTSAAASLTIDQTAPALSMQSDGRTTLLAGGQTASVSVQVTDSGSGVDPASVVLQIAGHADIAGTAAGSGVFNFAVPIDDSIAAAGTSATVAFAVAAKDLAGNLGTLSGDAKAVLRVDRDAPAFANILIVDTPDYTDGNGRAFYKEGAPLTVQATITDGAGVDASSACLHLPGDTGACAQPGTAGAAANTFTFSLPRPSAPMDGTTPLDFTLSANDTLAALLSGASQAEHEGTSDPQHVFFDNQPPAIAVVADTAPYARGGTAVLVTATISDPTGVVNPQLNSGANHVAGTLVSGSTYSFSLNPADAPAAVEGAYTFTVSASDHLGHAGSAPGSRIIDDAPPALSLQIYQDAPDGGVVTYPATVANTGHTGDSFIYSDTVHVAGSLSDVSGIDLADVHIDGIELDGGVSTGATRSLGCTAGATACTFDLQVALNDAQNGAFHTGTSDAGFNGAAIPSGMLHFVIDARDRAQGADGTPLEHTAATNTPARATRFLWQQAVTSGNVSGLGVHPSGDVIVTTNATSGNTVYDMAPDQPLVRWSYGNGLALVPSLPAIGAGDASSAPIYVADFGGQIDAISPTGSTLWSAAPATVFSVAPAVATVSLTGGGTTEEVVIPDNNFSNRMLWTASASTASSPNSAAYSLNNGDSSSAPLVLGGYAWFGNGGGVERHQLQNDGAVGAGTTVESGGAFAHQYWGLISDGTNAIAATDRSATSGGVLVSMSNGATPGANWTFTLTRGLSSEPTIGIDGKIVASDNASTNTVSEYSTSTGSASVLVNPGGAGRVPLQGSDGHWYLPRATGYLIAYEGTRMSWVFDPPNTIVRSAAMDCAGRLFVATGSTVYAFITDDHGLADTAWPSMRRDARNTGNTSYAKYGMRTASGCTQ